MSYYSMTGIGLLCCSFSVALAESKVEFSQIEEAMLLNPPSAGRTSNRVMIYSNVRDKIINKAMNSQFDGIENMMFINTVIESETGELTHSDDECD